MKKQWSYTILIILAGIALVIWSRVIFADSGSGITVRFLDVGQGDAILINLPKDEQVLIDGGPDDAVLSQISKYMPPFDRKIEHVVLTHPHADHLAGLVKVIERYDVGEVLETGADYSSATYKRWQDDIKSKNIPDREIRQSDEFQWGPIKFEVLWPTKSSASTSGESAINNTSVVGRLVYGQSEVMLTGDAEKEVQENLCKIDKFKLVSDVIKIAHHGSNNGADECFLQAVEAKTAVISVGRGNKFGHPHADAINLISKYVYNILRTDEKGTVSCEMSETTINCM